MKKSTLFILLLFQLTVYGQVPVYNSYAQAKPVIYLDFDGHYVTGTNWNMTGGAINCAAANLSPQQMTEVFNRVAEDYRPFHINITTDSAKYHAAPVKQRMRVIFTVSNEWYGSNAGGTAYVNSFTWGSTPCFVFTKLHNYNTKNISEAASHEAGHTLGLRHQAVYDANCVKLSDYHTGTGSGDIGWAPIMGVGYYRNQTTWHNGPMPSGCNTAQDDLAIITNSTNGFGYRSDVASSLSNPLPISTVQNQMNTTGLIATTVDTDVYTFRLDKPAQLQVKVAPYGIAQGDQGSNLDVEARLYNSAKQLLQTYNPAETLNASIDTLLSSGDYYLSVTGVGNAYASEYASLGSYSISGTLNDPQPLPLRKLLLKGKTEGNRHQLFWEIDADEKVVNQAVEIAGNNGAFTQLLQPAPADRMHHMASVQPGVVQYRVRVKFDDGKQYYSNTIALRSNAAGNKPHLLSNRISGTQLIVNTAMRYQYMITEVSGRVMKSGQITEGANIIPTGHLSCGIYLIRFFSGSDSFVEKFTRQ